MPRSVKIPARVGRQNVHTDLRRRIAANVRRLRHSRKLLQEELAYRAKVHQTYLSDLECGKRNPTVLLLGRIAGALGVDVVDLLRRSP